MDHLLNHTNFKFESYPMKYVTTRKSNSGKVKRQH